MVLKVEKVLSCIIVFVILMSAMQGTVFAVNSGDSATTTSSTDTVLEEAHTENNSVGNAINPKNNIATVQGEVIPYKEKGEVLFRGEFYEHRSDSWGGVSWELEGAYIIQVLYDPNNYLQDKNFIDVLKPEWSYPRMDYPSSGTPVEVYGQYVVGEEDGEIRFTEIRLCEPGEEYGTRDYFLRDITQRETYTSTGTVTRVPKNPSRAGYYGVDLDDPDLYGEVYFSKFSNGPQVDNVAIGDKVEICGSYQHNDDDGWEWALIDLITSDHYLKKKDSEPTQFYIRPACQDINGNHLNDVNYEFVDYPTYKGTCDYNEYLKAPGQGTYWVKFTKGDLEATVTLESHTKTFTGTVVTLREKEKEPKLCTSPDPPSHNFGMSYGPRPPWNFYITNCGDGTLTWSVSSDKSWITVDPLSGSTTTEIGVTVTVDTYELEPGEHTGYITVTSNGGSKTGTIHIGIPPEEEKNQLPVNPTLTPDKSSPQPAGTSIKWTASATDPDGDQLYYQFAMTRPATGDSWSIVRAWSTDNTWTWSTSSADEGTSDIIVGIRDGHHASTDSYDCITRVEDYRIGYPLVVSAYDVDGTPASELKGTTTVELISKGETSPTMAKTINNENKAIFTNIPDGTYYIKIWHDPQIEQGSKEFWGPFLYSLEFSMSAGTTVGIGHGKDTPYVEAFSTDKSTVDINTPVNLNVVVKVPSMDIGAVEIGANAQVSEANLKASVIIRDEDGHEVYRDTSSEKVVQKGDSTTFSFSFTPTKKGTYYGLAKAYLAGGGDVCTDNFGWVEMFEVGGEKPKEDYSALIKCISSDTDFYNIYSESFFDGTWWNTKARTEMESVWNTLVITSAQSGAQTAIVLKNKGTISKVLGNKVFTAMSFIVNVADITKTTLKAVGYSQIGTSIEEVHSVSIRSDLYDLIKNGNNLMAALSENDELRIEGLLEERAYRIKEIYADLSVFDKRVFFNLNNPTIGPATFPSWKYAMIHETAGALRCQLQLDYLVTISELNNLAGVSYNLFLHEEVAEGKITPKRLDNTPLKAWCFGCLDYAGDTDNFIVKVPKSSLPLFLEICTAYNLTFELKGNGVDIKKDKFLATPISEGTYTLTVICKGCPQAYSFYAISGVKYVYAIAPDIQPTEGPCIKKTYETEIIIDCPINATITDQYNRIISDNGTNEIPNAKMSIMYETKIFYLPADLTYSTEIDAYDAGTFNFTRLSPVGNNISITKFENVPITSTTKALVEIVPEETNYTMSIDYNGDGEYESNILPDVSETIEVGPILATIEVAPSTKTLYSDNTQQFTATAKDQYGDPVTGITIEWTSSNTAAGTVSPASATTGSDGTAITTFRAASAGTTTVKAAYGNVSGTASVTVQTKTEEPTTVKRGGGGGGGGGPIDIDGDGISDLSEKVDGTNRYDPCDPDPDCFACLAKLGLTPKPKSKERSTAMMPFGAAMPAATETTTEPTAETVTSEPVATPAPKQPGFEAIVAIVGLLAVAYVSVRRKRK